MKLILIGNARLFALSSCTPMYVAHGYRAACLINYEYNPPALFFNDFQRAVKFYALSWYLPSIWNRSDSEVSKHKRESWIISLKSIFDSFSSLTCHNLNPVPWSNAFKCLCFLEKIMHVLLHFSPMFYINKYRV